MSESLRIAWFSPLPLADQNQASGSAYLSSQVLPHLYKEFEIDLFHSQTGEWQGRPVLHYLSAWQRHERQAYDLFFYQLEDHASSDYIRMHLGLVPGLVCFHDCLASRSGPAALGMSRWRQSIREFNSGERKSENENERDAGNFWREAGLAGVALFSDPSQHVRYRGEQPLRLESDLKSCRSFNLFWPVDPRPGSVRVPGDGKCIAYCGSPRVEHRAHKLLEALSESERAYHLLWLLAREEEAQARGLVAEYGTGGVEIRVGRTPEAWQALLTKADIAVHTFFSVIGQPGPYLNISLMMGLPCIVNDGPTFDHLSPDLVFKVRPGSTEAIEIGAVLRALAEMREFTGRAAQREFAREMFATEVVAKELGLVFRESSELMREMMGRSDELRKKQMSRVLARIREGFGETEGQCPLGADTVWNLHEPAFREFGWL